MAISVAPLTTVVMNAVEEEHAGIASGINNAVSRTAGLISVAVMGLIVLAVFNLGLDSSLELLEVAPDVRQSLDSQRVRLAGAEIPSGIGAVLRAALERAVDEAFVRSFRLVMALAAGLALLSALTARLTLDGGRPTQGNVA